MDVVFFASHAELHGWLELHCDDASELFAGFYRKHAGKTGITYPEAVDEALCFGWIDGVRRTIDGERYTNRFTPRKPDSNWSAVNIKRAGELIALGRMQPSGLKTFESRRTERSNQYSYENRPR